LENKWSKKKLFYSSIKRGTGEAYLLICKYPEIDFSREIIKVCLKNYTLDGQSENSRGFYLYEIINQSNQREEIKLAIFKGLNKGEGDTWDLTQLFDLVKFFAQDGDKKAKKIIYNKYLNHPLKDSDWLGEDEILELDGLNGLKFIAEKKGMYLKKNPDEWEDEQILNNFQEDNPTINVWSELKKESKYNLNIKHFLKEIEKNKELIHTNIRPTISYINVVAKVLNNQSYHKPQRKFTKNDLIALANQLKVEKNTKNIEKLLWIFRSNKYPFNSEFLLHLAQKKANSTNRIVSYSIECLQHIESENIRKFVLNKLKTTSRPEYYTIALKSNYKEEDNLLLKEIAEKIQNIYRIENLAFSYVDIYQSNHTIGCKEPLEVIYNKLTCGIHRYEIVKILKENRVLSEKINNEIKYDSYKETRELYEIRETGS